MNTETPEGTVRVDLVARYLRAALAAGVRKNYATFKNDRKLVEFADAVRNDALEACAVMALEAEPQSGLAGSFRAMKVP